MDVKINWKVILISSKDRKNVSVVGTVVDVTKVTSDGPSGYANLHSSDINRNKCDKSNYL